MQNIRIKTSVIGRAQRDIGRAQLNIGRASALPGLYKTTPVSLIMFYKTHRHTVCCVSTNHKISSVAPHFDRSLFNMSIERQTLLVTATPARAALALAP